MADMAEVFPPTHRSPREQHSASPRIQISPGVKTIAYRAALDTQPQSRNFQSYTVLDKQGVARTVTAVVEPSQT